MSMAWSRKRVKVILSKLLIYHKIKGFCIACFFKSEGIVFTCFIYIKYATSKKQPFYLEQTAHVREYPFWYGGHCSAPQNAFTLNNIFPPSYLPLPQGRLVWFILIHINTYI